MSLATDIGLIAKAAESSGADPLMVSNTYPAMAIDFRTGKSKPGNLAGRPSGPPIKPITLRLVWQARKAVRVPVVGLGGVETAEDVLDYLRVGASAVQVGTASFADPRASEAIIGGLGPLVRTVKCNTISELRGRFGIDFG